VNAECSISGKKGYDNIIFMILSLFNDVPSMALFVNYVLLV
jgi:hypothetical protein